MKLEKTVDLRGVCCPINFVKAKLALEEIEKGEILEIILDEGEPILNVPRSLKEEGHIVKKVIQEDRYFRIYVEKS